MHVERLKHLITILERVEKERKTFDMEGWGTYSHALDCQTSGCALGYACFDSLFQSQGLSYEFMMGPNEAYYKDKFVPIFNTFDKDPLEGFIVGEKFFELDRDQTYYIFEKKLNDSIEKVINRIKEVIELGNKQ